MSEAPKFSIDPSEAPNFNEVDPELMFDYEARHALQAGEVVTPDTYFQQRYGEGAGDAAYFDQARADHYDGTHESYEDLSMSELADELAYAELTEDKTKIDDISDVLLDKMSAFADAQVTERHPDGMDAEAQMSLFDRVMKLKDQKKLHYLETNGHEISDRVRSEVMASANGGSEADTPAEPAVADPESAEVSEKPSIEEMEAEFVARLKEAGQAATEGREDAGRLLEEAQELGSKVYKAQIAELLASANAAAAESNFEEAVKMDEKARQILEEYLKLNGIDSDSDEARTLRENLENAIAGSNQDVFAIGSDDEAEDGFIPEGSFDGNDELPPVPSGSGREEPAQPQSRWEKIKGILGFDREKQDKKTSRTRKFLGGAALAGVVLFGAGFLVGNAAGEDGSERPASTTSTTIEATTTTTTTTPEDELPESVREEIEQHEALEGAGVTDEAVRTSIIHNPEEFKRMVENPELFASMLKWHDNRVEELMQNDPALSRAEAQARAEKQFRDFVEDLDDDDEEVA